MVFCLNHDIWTLCWVVGKVPDLQLSATAAACKRFNWHPDSFFIWKYDVLK